MEQFAAYGHAIVSLALFALIGLILSPWSAARKSSAGMASGATPEPDYSDPIYRLNRAYMNATETMGLFAGALVAAILAGASPFWVNLLASIFLLSRIAQAFVHIRGIGSQNAGPRTLFYTIGWACAIVMAVLAIWAVFF